MFKAYEITKWLDQQKQAQQNSTLISWDILNIDICKPD